MICLTMITIIIMMYIVHMYIHVDIATILGEVVSFFICSLIHAEQHISSGGTGLGNQTWGVLHYTCNLNVLLHSAPG